MATVKLEREELRSLVADAIDAETEQVTDSAHFVDELGVDSLMSLEVMVVLENTYKIKFDEDELAKITCFDAAFDLVAAKLGAG